MASTIVETYYSQGHALTLDLYPFGSDTRANGSGDTLTEATNRKGVYTATVTEAISGWHTAHLYSGTICVAVYHLYLQDDTSTYRTEDSPVALHADLDPPAVNATQINGNATAAATAAAFWASQVTGTAQAGGASTITLESGESSTDDFYNDMAVVIVSGTGAGQVRRITDYVGSTRAATVSAAWVTNPDSSSVYQLIGRIE